MNTKTNTFFWEAPAMLQVLLWAREAAETTRAFHDKHEDCEPPSWLAELEAVLPESRTLGKDIFDLSEVLVWTRDGSLPDSEITVLVFTKEGDVLEGFYDSEHAAWRKTDASLINCAVVAWADMPAGPDLSF